MLVAQLRKREVPHRNMTEDLELAKKIADICFDKLASNTLVLELGPESPVCDYFVIADAPTRNQLSDISHNIQDGLEIDGLRPKSVQGKQDNSWILLDYGTVVVHLFMDRERDYYNLEGLWRNAPVVYEPDKERQA